MSYLRIWAIIGFVSCGIFVGISSLKRQPYSVSLSSTKSKNNRLLILGQPLNQGHLKSNKDIKQNDPSIHNNWGINGTHSAAAWNKITKGSRKVVVAVIDTGIDTNHVDLKDNLWSNPGEIGLDKNGHSKSFNGIDDDNNGYVDDVHGWDFVNNKPIKSDKHGHGTHVSGIIGAVGNNGIGISGISPRVSLMPLNYYNTNSSDDSQNLENTVKAIYYAINNGAHIINYSGGGPESNPKEFAAIKKAFNKGVLFVAAAGNKKPTDKVNSYYPADYGLPNIISVTAINQNNNVLSTSNFNESRVDIAAPGGNIYSTLPNNQYGFMTGTSQATPFVSGVAALIKAKYPDFSPQQIKKQLTTTGDLKLHKLNHKTKNRTVLNTYRALSTLGSNVSANGAFLVNNRQQFDSSTKKKDSSTFSSGIPFTINQLTDFLKPSK
ncbi:MAG: S8 family serine peptidase [Bdellovibrionaceae bacterium]|nr:S8 family serine peptidase [Pseudobdellovibrionaceae bacterium]